MGSRRRYDWRSILDGRGAWEELPANQRLRWSIVSVAFCAAMVVGVLTGWVEAQGGRVWLTLGALVAGAAFIHYGIQAARQIKNR